MKNKVNFHTHTYRCNHAVGTEEDYIKEAIALGFKCIGISDHGPYPDDRLGLRMKYEELLDYSTTVNNLKEKYKNEIDVYTALEIEYMEDSIEYYNYLINDLKVDYLALGQHVFYHKGEFANSFELTNTEEYISYAKTIEKAMESGYFKFLCHPDLVLLNNFPWDDNCEKASNIIIAAAKKYNMILEVNGNGVRRGIMTFADGNRYAYPHKKFWQKVRKENLPVIVNADCHNPKHLWDEKIEEAYDFAREMGLNIVYNIF